jgi:hypothetical protein
MSYVLDLDKFRPEPLDITIGGKKFFIEKIPMDISLDFYELIPIFTELETSKKLKKADYFKILQLIYEICKLSDETLELEWLRRQMTIEIFNDLSPKIFLAAFSSSKKNKENEVDSLKSI